MEEQGMRGDEGKLPEERAASLEELKDLLKHIETDELPADMVSVVLNHLCLDVSDAALDGKKLDWEKLKTFVGMTELGPPRGRFGS
jgi:hypothetical protein